MKEVDVLIVGSGPAGNTAAIYIARAGLKPVVLEGITNAGGSLMNTTDIENFPGFIEGIAGSDLINNMQEQAKRFGAEYIADEVEEFQLTDDKKVIKTMMGEEYQAKAVVLGLGSLYKSLGCEGETKFQGRGVSYCATCDGFFFKDQELIVVGGGDTAMEEALYLTRFATKVTIVHRRDVLRASKIMQQRAKKHPQIEFQFNQVIEQIKGSEKVSSVVLKDTKTGELKELSCGGVFVAIGCTPSTSGLQGQLDLDMEGHIITQNNTSQTSIPGVFAAGDCIDPIYRQAIIAAGSGAKAGIDAEKYLEQI